MNVDRHIPGIGPTAHFGDRSVGLAPVRAFFGVAVDIHVDVLDLAG
jgi:hypothetical protein